MRSGEGWSLDWPKTFTRLTSEESEKRCLPFNDLQVCWRDRFEPPVKKAFFSQTSSREEARY